MILCLDVGNTHIFVGIFEGNQLRLRLRCDTRLSNTADQLGIFLKAALRENNINEQAIKHVSVCSVVPNVDYAVRMAFRRYFNLEPFFLKAGVKTGIRIKSSNPTEVGSDLIAGAVAALHDYPDQNIVVIDLGTATTFSIVSFEKEFLGAVILAGIKTSMQALGACTAKLFNVEIIDDIFVLGRTTTESIQSGLYYGHLGAMREILQKITQEIFQNKLPTVIGTGGFAHLFEKEKIFTTIDPNLLLRGLLLVLQRNLMA